MKDLALPFIPSPCTFCIICERFKPGGGLVSYGKYLTGPQCPCQVAIGIFCQVLGKKSKSETVGPKKHVMVIL